MRATCLLAQHIGTSNIVGQHRCIVVWSLPDERDSGQVRAVRTARKPIIELCKLRFVSFRFVCVDPISFATLLIWLCCKAIYHMLNKN